jgi:hypothetical protein
MIEFGLSNRLFCNYKFRNHLIQQVYLPYMDGLQPNEALMFGSLKDRDAARIVTEAACALQPDAVSRTRRCFEFAASPGMFMLDHDPSENQALAPEELIGIIRGLTPCLSTVAMVWRASASSSISSEDDTIDTGIAGQRLYLPVTEASLIPEAGKALIDLLWAQGHGYIKIGKAGQALERTLVDASVWQPERLDFAAPPVLGPGLTRNPPPGSISGEPGAWLDLRELIQAADGTVRSRAAAARKSARLDMKSALAEAREVWVEETAPAIAQRQARPVEEVKATLWRACNHLLLTGDFPLEAADGSTPTVGELLDNPALWHNQRFADPLEPDYGGDSRIAWANLRSGRQPIFTPTPTAAGGLSCSEPPRTSSCAPVNAPAYWTMYPRCCGARASCTPLAGARTRPRSVSPRMPAPCR